MESAPLSPPTAQLSHRLDVALAILADAYSYARQAQLNVWEFAVEIDEFRAAGVTTAELRYLVSLGYAEHLVETGRGRARRRSFRSVAALTFPERTCLVLTELGATLACTGNRPSPQAIQVGCAPLPYLIPDWDNLTRNLRLGVHVVKHFARLAPCQGLILSAFQEMGWPRALDDPLPPQPGQDAPERLHNTVKNLNHGQCPPFVHFSSCAVGRMVSWDVIFSQPRRNYPLSTH